MSKGDTQVLDFEKICRLCLMEKRSLSAIFSKKKSDSKVPLPIRIMTCASLELYEGDGLPASICGKCLLLVNQSFAFREQCEQSDTTLRQYLQEKSLNTEPDTPSTPPPPPPLPVTTLPEPTSQDEPQVPDPTTCQMMMMTEAKCKMEVEEPASAYDYLHLEVCTPSQQQQQQEDEEDDEWTEDDFQPLSNIKVKPTGLLKVPKMKDVPRVPKIKIPKPPKVPKIKPPKQPRILKPTFIDCEVCGKSVQRRKFKLHMMVHNGEKPHLCDTCGKSFTWKFALVTHKRVHSGEKPYLCKHCGQSFRSSSRFAEHSTIHTGRKSYVCEHCALAFRTSGRLKRHLRIHTGEKPYKCSFCERGFSESYNLKQHLRLHTGEKPPHVCSICAQAFIRKKMLLDHIRLHHGILPPAAHMLMIKTDSTVREGVIGGHQQDTKIGEHGEHMLTQHGPSVININITFD